MTRKILSTLAALALLAVGTLIAPSLAGGSEIEPNANPGCVGRLAQITNVVAVNPEHVAAVVGQSGTAAYTVVMDNGQTFQGFGSQASGVQEVNNALNCRTIGDQLGKTPAGL